MVRKTREQVWRELEQLGEEEVRSRLAAQPAAADEAPLVQEWLAQKERVAAELAATRLGPAARSSRRPGAGKVVGGVAVLSLTTIALGLLLARRRK